MNVPKRVDGGGISNGVVNVGLIVAVSVGTWPGPLLDLDEVSIMS